MKTLLNNLIRKKSNDDVTPRNLVLESLEERVLYSAAPVPVDAPVPEAEMVIVVVDDAPTEASTQSGGIALAPVDASPVAAEAATGHLAEAVEIEGVTVQNIETVINNGSSENRIDIAFIGEGFTSTELDDYAEKLDTLLQGVFAGDEANESNFPYLRYANFFNVHRIDVVSPESGIDLNNQADIDTPFDGGQSATTPRIATGDYNLMSRVTDQALDLIGVESDAYRAAVYNTDTYVNVGAHGLAIYAQDQSNPVKLLLHEAAHSWHDIADEYGGNDGTPYTGGENDAINITIDETGDKWENWVGYNQPGIGEIGTYEGAQYYNEGRYRPSEDSMMRSAFDQGFNAPSREKIILDLYDRIEILDGHLKNDVVTSENETFWVDSIDPSLFKVEWSVDGAVVATGDAETFQYDFSNLSAGDHIVTARVYDEIVDHAFSDDDNPHALDLVRRDLDKLQQVVEWRVHVGDTPVIDAPTEIAGGDPLNIRVIANAIAGQQQISVALSSGADQESVVLQEVALGVFEGSINTTFGSQDKENGLLSVAEGSAAQAVNISYSGISISTTIVAGPLGAIRHLDLNEAEGVALENATVNGATWSVGPDQSGALDFDGSNDYIALDSDIAPVLGASASMSFWINTTQTGGSWGWNSPAIAGHKDGTAHGEYYWGWINDEGKINVSFGAWDTAATSTEPINDGEWHYVTLTRNAANGSLAVYVDGELNEKATGLTGVNEGMIESLGRRENRTQSGELTGASYFDGMLDDIRIYDRVLNADEVASLSARYDTPPSVEGDSIETEFAQAITTEDLRANDAAPHDVTGHTQAENGTVTYQGDGVFTYQPNSGFSGPDTFTYTVTDGLKSTTAIVSVTVNPAPVVQTDNLDPAIQRIDELSQDVPVIFGGLVAHGEVNSGDLLKPLFGSQAEAVPAGKSLVFFGKAQPNEKVVLRLAGANGTLLERVVIHADSEGHWKMAFDGIDLNQVIKLKVKIDGVSQRYRINPSVLGYMSETGDSGLAMNHYQSKLFKPQGTEVDGISNSKSRFSGLAGDLLGV